MQKQPPTQRHLDMMAAYNSGMTLQQVGDKYGLTRERVRQILHSKFGFSVRPPLDKPRAPNGTVGPLERQRREERCWKVYGMSYLSRQLHLQEHGRKPYRAYTVQRCAAAQRGRTA